MTVNVEEDEIWKVDINKYESLLTKAEKEIKDIEKTETREMGKAEREKQKAEEGRTGRTGRTGGEAGAGRESGRRRARRPPGVLDRTLT